MTKQDKKLLHILRRLIKKTENHEYTFWIDDEGQRLYLFNSDIYVPFSKTVPNLQLTLQHLEKEEYLTTNSPKPDYFQLGYNAIYYDQILWAAFGDFVLKSICVPISVSFITSFLATVIAYLWNH